MTSTMSLSRGQDDLSVGSEPAINSVRARTLGFRRGFGATLLAAMHESRERQAPRPQSGGTMIKIAIVTIIIVFGVLHIIGGTMLERSVRAQGETGTAVLSRD